MSPHQPKYSPLDKEMSRKRDYPLPFPSSVIPLIGFVVAEYRLSCALGLTKWQFSVLLLVANNGLKGVTVSWLMNAIYKSASHASMVSAMDKLTRLVRLGLVEKVDNRYRLTQLAWEKLAVNLEELV